MISLIVAMGKNNVIGLNNDMPWHLPNDLAHFKKVTTGHTIVMGRKTYESIGRPLPNRKNVVLTRQQNNFPEEVTIINELNDVYRWSEQSEEEIFIIGGGHIYKQSLPFADRLYVTQINETFKGDTFFPEFSNDEWKLIAQTKGIKDENNPYDYDFLQYDRIKDELFC